VFFWGGSAALLTQPSSDCKIKAKGQISLL
jgi:hypothetical protein